MRKLIAVLIVCCVFVSLMACGKGATEPLKPAADTQLQAQEQNMGTQSEGRGEPDGGLLKLRAMELGLPDGMVYATAQCRMDDKIWIGGAGGTGAVIGYVSFDGRQELMDMPESCEYVYAMCGVDGKLAVLGGSLPNLYTDANGEIVFNDSPEGRIELMIFDGGELVSTTPLAESYSGSNMTFKLMYECDGVYYMQAQSIIIKVASDGTELARYALENNASFTASYLLDDQLIASKTEFGSEDTEICLLRLSDLELDNSFVIERCTVAGFGASEDSELLANTDNGVFFLSIYDGLGESVFLWNELYLSESFKYIEQLDNGYLFYEPYQSSVYYAKYELLEHAPEELVLATDLSFGPVFSLVNEYNKSQDKYHISIKTYDVFEDSGSLERLRTEIGAGAGPDIFAFSQDESLYEVKPENIYVNLYEYLDVDTECGRNNFVRPLLDAMSEHGNLYWLPYRFSITTLTGPRALLGGSEVSLDNIERIDAVKNGDLRVFHSWLSADYLLNWCIKSAISTYMDKESKSCSFDSEGFMQLLEMCNRYAGNTDIDKADMNEDVLLMFDTVSNFLRLCVLSKLDYCFAGFPGADGNGSMFQLDLKFAISSLSSSQDAAWDFLKFTASERGQAANTGTGFSATLSVLEKDVEYTVKNGVLVGSTKYEYSKEAAQEFMDLLDSTTVVSNADIVVTNIIMDLTAPYFAGGQSVEQTAQNIQSRVSIYLNE